MKSFPIMDFLKKEQFLQLKQIQFQTYGHTNIFSVGLNSSYCCSFLKLHISAIIQTRMSGSAVHFWIHNTIPKLLVLDDSPAK
jgi:hypothetical protein